MNNINILKYIINLYTTKMQFIFVSTPLRRQSSGRGSPLDPNHAGTLILNSVAPKSPN